jgi:hypothetical protein
MLFLISIIVIGFGVAIIHGKLKKHILSLKILRSKPEKIYDYIFYLLLTFSCLIQIFISIGRPYIPTGEYDDYFLTTIALDNHRTLEVLPSDIEQAIAETEGTLASTHLQTILSSPNFLFKTSDGKLYPHYFGTYSLISLPLFKLFRLLKIDVSKSFLVTNVLLYGIAIFFAYKQLRVEKYQSFLAALLLTFSPIILYNYLWVSAESCIFSLLLISAVYLTNNEHYKAAIFASLAGTLNFTIMVFGVVIIVDFIYHIYLDSKNKGENNLFRIIENNIKNIVFLALCYIPFIIVIIFNLSTFGSISTAIHEETLTHYWQRVHSYLFDLNHGVFPFYPLLIILIPIYLLHAIKKRKSKTLLLFIGFIGVLFGFSLHWHINSGKTGIARYNAWNISVLIILLTSQLNDLFSANWKKVLLSCLLILSSGYCFFIVINSADTYYVYMSTTAQFVMDRVPSLYNPYPFTFVSRIDHVDGGYYFNEPLIYYDSRNGQIRKILVTNDTVDDIVDNLSYRKDDEHKIFDKIKKAKSTNGFSYINFNRKIPVYYKNN